MSDRSIRNKVNILEYDSRHETKGFTENNLCFKSNIKY